MPPSSLLEHFADLTEPRVERTGRLPTRSLPGCWCWASIILPCAGAGATGPSSWIAINIGCSICYPIAKRRRWPSGWNNIKACTWRDRGGAFAEGACRAAPQALQVADRFHVLLNVRQTLDHLLVLEHRVLARVAETLTTRTEPPATPEPSEHIPMTRVVREHAAAEARRQVRYDRVAALAKVGYSPREIARRAGVSRGTVRTYFRAGQYRPCAPRCHQPQTCTPFASYLRDRWAVGEHNSAMFLAEIRRWAIMERRRRFASWSGPGAWDRIVLAVATMEISLLGFLHHPDTAFRPTKPVGLCYGIGRNWMRRSASIVKCSVASTTIATAQMLAQEFGWIVRTRATSALAPWLAGVTQSRILELVSFVHGVHRDAAASIAALRSTYGPGQTEDQVNRVKMLKRQMYGRAKFDLLRLRVLYNIA